jgi:hypothetical protein
MCTVSLSLLGTFRWIFELEMILDGIDDCCRVGSLWTIAQLCCVAYGKSREEEVKRKRS